MNDSCAPVLSLASLVLSVVGIVQSVLWARKQNCQRYGVPHGKSPAEGAFGTMPIRGLHCSL